MATVSVVIPARSWDGYLQETLRSIRAQDLPQNVEVEVVVALADLVDVDVQFPDGVRAIHNPSGSIPDGLNSAIGETSGEVVVRVDSRCVLQPDHVRRVLLALDDRQVGCVGGAQLVLDRGLFGSAYAMAFNSPLMGPTVYRYRRRSGPVDTAYLGAWRRSDLDAAGGFDPRLLRNQDNELADRIRGSGLIVLYDSAMVIGYHNARGFTGAIRHHHEFGFWRMRQRTHGQRALTPRHVAALGGLGLAAASAGAALAKPQSRRVALGAVVVAYAGASMVSLRSARALRRTRPDIEGPDFHMLAPAMAPAVAGVLNGAWLVGLLRGSLWRDRGAPPPTA